MGQQFYVIRNNPAPNTEAVRAKEQRDAEKRKRKGLPAGLADAGNVQPRTPRRSPSAPPPRQQPKKQPRSQRKKGAAAASPAASRHPASRQRPPEPAEQAPSRVGDTP